MNFLQRAMVRMGAGLVKQFSMGGKTLNTTDPALVRFLNGYTASGQNVTPDRALQQSTVFTCVRIIAETVGVLPASVYEVDGDNLTKVDHDLGDILFNTPNTDMTGVELIEADVANLALGGNSYSLIGWSGTPGKSRVTSLYPLPYDSVLTKRADNGTISYKYNDRGRWEDVPRELMWHVKGFGGNGLTGLSPIGYQREMIGMALATQDFQSKFFSNGATPSWIISVPQWLTKDQRIIARENIEKLWGGSENAYRAQMLEGGMSAVAGTMPLQDAQFLELKGATKADIFGIYRIPPHLGGELGRATNNNIEQQSMDFVMHCILPYLNRLERSISRWLLQPGERRKYRVRWNVEGLLRADAAARGTLYSMLLQNGVLNRNEVRALEGRNRVDDDGMDDYTVQTAMVPIDRLGAIADVQATPKPAPVLPAPAPGGGKAGTQNFAIMLPDSMRHEVKQLVTVPGLEDLLAQIVKANANNEATGELVRERIKAMMELADRIRGGQSQLEDSFATGMEKLANLVSADRVLVEDERGFAVRSRLDLNH